jgi:hypothetical protein
MNLRSANSLAYLILLGLLAVSVHTAHAAETKCDGISRYVTLGTEPVLVNPGGKCMLSLTFTFQQTVPPTIPKFCYFVRQAGSSKTFGPFCIGDNDPASKRFNVRPEYIWSADQPLNASIRLEPYPKR